MLGQEDINLMFGHRVGLLVRVRPFEAKTPVQK
jgi:hypothetical protein